MTAEQHATRMRLAVLGHATERMRLAVTPQSIVTLRVADERDRTMWAAESVALIRARMADGRRGACAPEHGVDGPLIKLTRLIALQPSEFWTRYDNIANLEPHR